MSTISKDISKLKLGFLGCGKISSAMIRGYCTAPERPARVFVSKRSEDKSRKLNEDFPDIVEISDSNEYIVENSDIIFLGLLPNVAREILPPLNFNGKFIVTMMAAINYDEVLTLTKCDSLYCLKIVPLPSASRRSGPIVAYPKSTSMDTIISIVGTLIGCDTELDMKPMIAIAGQISPFYELMKVTQDFLLSKGISEEVSYQYVSSFYSGLANDLKAPFGELTEEAATHGGLNEQALKFMRGTDHYDVVTQSLELIYERLTKK